MLEGLPADSLTPRWADQPAPIDARGARQPWVTDLPRQLVVCGLGWGGYMLMYVVLAWLYPLRSQKSAAITNARHLIDLERALHVFDELQFQRWVTHHELVRQLLTGVYLYAHLPLIVVLAVWLYAKHRPRFVLTRNGFLISGAIALACELLPIAPPHLVPGFEFVNTAASRAYDIVEPKSFFDPYGALPSIHVSWALLMGLAIWCCTRSPWTRGAAVALPVLMSLAVVATGNHYWADVATGVLAGLAGVWLGAKLMSDRSTTMLKIEGTTNGP